MPLRCFDTAGNGRVHAFDLSAEEWQALVLKNRNERHLRMPCCSSQVTLKKSPLGTQFFAHKGAHSCSTAPETESHLRLKQMAVAAARASGWDATTEVVGTTPAGEQWKADVLASKGDWKVAIEIQLSSQTNEETLRRQQRYSDSNVRGLWLLRQRGFPITRDLPAARIDGAPREGFFALVPTRRGEQNLLLEEFLEAAFSKRLRYGFPVGVAATVSVQAANTDCWKCGARTRIITRVCIAFGPHEYDFSVSDLGEYPDLSEIICDRLPIGIGIGAIKRRYSKTQGRSYLSNGCIYCDSLYGDHFELVDRYCEETVSVFSAPISERWREAIEKLRDGEPGWGVYPLT
jgi:hypothetical protein